MARKGYKTITDQRLLAYRAATRSARGHSSPLLAQLDEILQSSALGREKLAVALGLSPKNMVKWLTGAVDPLLSNVERVLHHLGYTVVVIPFQEAQVGTKYRELLPLVDRTIYDSQSSDPIDALNDVMRAVQSRLVDMERRHRLGALSAEKYHEEFTSLVHSTCKVADAMARQQLSNTYAALGEDVQVLFEGDEPGARRTTVKRIGPLGARTREVTGAPPPAAKDDVIDVTPEPAAPAPDPPDGEKKP